MGFPGDTVVKNHLANVGDTRDTGFHPWVRKKEGRKEGNNFLPREGNGHQLQHSCLENSMDRRAWWATVHEVSRSRT